MTIYGFEPPEPLSIRKLLLLRECPAADGPGSKLPDCQLERWKSLYAAIRDWYRADEPEEQAVPAAVERQLGWLDAVQREIAEDLFTAWRRLFPKVPEEEIDDDPPWSRVYSEELHAELSAAVQIGIRSPRGVEFVKIRTGRTRSEDEEVAVLLEGAEEEGGQFVEAALESDDRIPLAMPPAERREHIARLFDTWTRHRERKQRGTRPGLHCFTCPRPARCGQYPEVGRHGRVRSGTRTVVITKKWLLRMKHCHRQTAWKRLYGIPEERDQEDDVDRWSRGSSFHKMIAAVILEDDPRAAFEIAIQAAAPSEVAHLRWLFDRHEQLVSAEPHPVSFKAAEYELGATFVVAGIDLDSRDRLREADVAVVFVARADATGSERDGTPAVVEHRTGSDPEIEQVELDLYALGAALLAQEQRAAVHLHHMGLPDGPVCEREVYDAGALQHARERLEPLAEEIAHWHPRDARSVRYEIGEWCRWCPFEERCMRFRDTRSAAVVPESPP